MSLTSAAAFSTGREAPPTIWLDRVRKFLIGRDGKILQRFDSRVKPEDPDLVKAIEDALGD